MRSQSVLRGRIVVRFIAIVVAVVIFSSVFVGTSPVSSASASVQSQQVTATSMQATAVAALSGSSFNPGLIISNYLFYKNNAMTQSEIQSFLDAKVVTCGNSNCLENKRTTTFDRPADRNVCGAYSGVANELTSTIIFKVQQACGISAKVLLVTLQKEQGLITKSAPSDAAIRVAMGYGCPDTAPCASQYFGLYNQLYKAAWQLKRYSTPDPWGNIQPGIEYVQYSPSAACGSKKVVVENNATAALYNYTPYTPNAAALANLNSTGDSCSAYGNRNFWVYYTTWFGSTLAGAGDEMIATVYLNTGAGSGVLGPELTPTTCSNVKTCTKIYQHGVIYWASAGGAIAVSGVIGDYYKANGGVAGYLGVPKSAAATELSTSNGNGQAQRFELGLVQSSSRGSFGTSGSILAVHLLAGGGPGHLGWPTAEKVCGLPGGGCSQSFQHGVIYAPGNGVAVVVRAGPIVDYYAALGGPAGIAGYPISPAVSVSNVAKGDGVRQAFVGGLVQSSASGTFIETGSILAAHTRAGGEAGTLGWLAGEKVCGLPGGACSQKFQFGTVYGRVRGLAIPVRSGPITDLYLASGGPAGALSYPRLSQVTVRSATNGSGFSQTFVGGMVFSSVAGAFIESGIILAKHKAVGGAAGRFGWPVAPQVCGLAGGGCSQQFQHGILYTKR